MSAANIKNKHFSPKKRLEILSQAEKLGNVSEVCKTHGINRSTFYMWHKRYQLDKSTGLNKRKNSFRPHPLKTSPEIISKVINLSLANPEWGCNRIALIMRNEDINISSPTVQKILVKEKLGSVAKRLFLVEEKYLGENLILSAKHLQMINKNDPCFKELNTIGNYPGEILVQDTFPIFNLLPSTYIHVIIDTYSSYAFAYPWSEKSADLASDLLSTKALRFFSRLNLPVKKVITDRGYEFTRQGKTYTNLLNRFQIVHEVYSGPHRNWNGFIERYKKSFFKRYGNNIIQLTDVVATSELINMIKNDRRNAYAPVYGYPNFGISPSSLIDKYKPLINAGRIEHSN